MKRLFKKIYDICKNFLLWVWRECRDWRTLALLAVVCIAIGTPVWGGYLLFLLFGWKWAFAVASGCLAFWWIPGVPFFTVSVTVTLAIKKIAMSLFKRKQRRKAEEIPASAPEEDTAESVPASANNEQEERQTGK